MNKKLFEVKSWVTLSNQPEITLTMGNTRKLHKGDNTFFSKKSPPLSENMFLRKEILTGLNSIEERYKTTLSYLRYGIDIHVNEIINIPDRTLCL